jgi:alanine dehydrogenase
MKKLRIALIREEKNPPETRVAFSPAQCLWLMNKYPELEIIVQPSSLRCFKDEEYNQEGVQVIEDVSSCNLLMGIKEVPADLLVSGKKYLFFSHTIKKQPQNRKLLQQALKKKIQLIDYECLVFENGERILGFGHYAGVVGAHNAFYAYGKKYNLFQLKRAYQCHDYQELLEQYDNIKIPPLKIA